jgi:phosphoribosylglycinamide formyltransferase
MIHIVTEQIDVGQLIVVEAIDMRDGESLEAFEERMHELEHLALVKGTAKVLASL